MVFSSYEFIVFFIVPIVFTYYIITRYSQIYAAGFLLFSSLLFYSFWSFPFLFLLLGSIAFNYTIGYFIYKKIHPKLLLYIGCSINLLGIFFFKYLNFTVGLLTQILSIEPVIYDIVLPLGISFYTFTQIAYLVDTYDNKTALEYNFIYYALFVTYFPHLVAGPILHHKQMVEQFVDKSKYELNYTNISIGLTYFIFGLFKKIVIADRLSPTVSTIFTAAHNGQNIYPLEAWVGVLAYTFQLYFDFSGYSDMAIGLSRLFNFSLPFNFNSPYKAKNLIDFWRRWHMSLSQFLRDYLYIRLGGNKHGKFKRYINLLITMTLGGLWHGANLTFLVWGLFHGIGLMINHFWQSIISENWINNKIYTLSASFVTFIFVVMGWTVFRSDNMTDSIHLMKSMFNLKEFFIIPQGLSRIFPSFFRIEHMNYVGATEILLVFICFIVCKISYNTQEIIEGSDSMIDRITYQKIWQPNFKWTTATIIILFTSIYCMSGKTEFLYFQF